MTDLTVDSTAREMVAAIASREISCAELMDLHLARIAERNPQLNAIVSLDEDRARDGASEADRTPYDERGPLHGLPWAFKDTHDVAGWRTTYGSPLYADHVPAARRADRRADPGGRRGADRQDERAGVRGRQPHVQHDLRHHPQPRRPDPERRRVQRGSGVRPRGRHGAAGRRLRHGRLAAQPRVVLRRGRPAAEPGPGTRVAERQPVGDHVGRWPDGSQRRRRGAAAERHRRARPAGAAGAGRPGRDLRAARLRHPRRAARRPEPRPRRRRSRSTTRWPRSSRPPAPRWRPPAPGWSGAPRPDAAPTRPSVPCAPGTSRPGSATSSPSTRRPSSPRSPTTSAPASR